MNGKYCVHSLEYFLMPFVDSFPDDTNTGHDTTLANTTPPATNAANPLTHLTMPILLTPLTPPMLTSWRC
jgi:hypothetical protein